MGSLMVRKRTADETEETLFASTVRGAQPLAARMRPRTLDEFVGQEHLLAPGKPLREAVERGVPGSMIFWGPPGSGKTTLAHQLMFANATPERPALYFTVLGEPAIKMLRYQQQYSFFDDAKMDGAIRFVNLSQVVLDQDLGAVLDAIIKEVETSNAKVVVVDS